ncbi:MAG: hypothetical protein RBS57_14010 [Desulforhabdus sp.]|jgi:hypothetical protein|nr:hypothetical protein [Desulforhabdus sp.]
MQHADTVIDACTVSLRGVMSLIEAPHYGSLLGHNGQKQIKTLLRMRQLVMSRVFLLGGRKYLGSSGLKKS